MASGVTPRPRHKATRPIEKDRTGELLMTKSQGAELAEAQLREDNKRQIKYGPRGTFVPKAGTNDSFPEA